MRYVVHPGLDNEDLPSSCLGMLMTVIVSLIGLLIVVALPLAAIDYFFGTNLVEGFLTWVQGLGDSL